MAGFDFEDGAGFEWVDSAGAEWDKDVLLPESSKNIIWLTRPQAVNLSPKYKCQNMTIKNKCLNISTTNKCANMSIANTAKNKSTINAAKSVSTIYICSIIIRGRVMTSIITIRIGHGEEITLKLQAERVDTGEVMNLTIAQMEDIERIVLHLDTTNKLDTNTAEVTLAAGGVFDKEVDQTNAKLVLRLGGLVALANMAETYNTPHLDIYFAGNSLPVPFAFPAIIILPND